MVLWPLCRLLRALRCLLALQRHNSLHLLGILLPHPKEYVLARLRKLPLPSWHRKGFKNHLEYETFKNRLVPENGRAVELAFDPNRLTGCVRVIWYQPVSRTIWLACRWRYLANQYYNGAVIMTAKQVILEKPRTWEHLRNIVRYGMTAHWGWGCVVPDQFFIQLLPFIVDALDELSNPNQLTFQFFIKYKFTWIVKELNWVAE